MRNMIIALTAVLAGALAVTDVMAQGRGGGRGGRGGQGGGEITLPMLLNNEKVAEAISLTDEQKTQVQEMRREQRGNRGQGGQGGQRGNFRDMSEEEREKMREERASQRAEQQKAEAEKLSAILDKGQIKRLEEIKIQVQGAAALLDPSVQSKLGLSSDTIASLTETGREAQQEMRDKMRELFSSGDRDGFREKATEMREAMQAKLLDLLTDSQKEEFSSMQGEKIDISIQDLMGGRGGRGGENARGGGRNRAEGGGRNRGAGRPELE